VASFIYLNILCRWTPAPHQHCAAPKMQLLSILARKNAFLAAGMPLLRLDQLHLQVHTA